MRKIAVLLLLSWFTSVCLAAGAPVRLVCLGDGQTEGEGDNGDRGSYGPGYPGRIQRSFDQRGTGGLVFNAGHSGWTTQMILDGKDNTPPQMKEALDFRPTVACVWVGTQDIWALYQELDPTPSEEKADRDHFRANLKTILSKLRGAGAEVYLTSLDDQSRRAAIQNGKIYSGINRNELKPMAAQIKEYNVILRDEARKNKCTLVDVTSGDLFLDPLNLYDGNNLNGVGYDQVTQRWLKAMKL